MQLVTMKIVCDHRQTSSNVKNSNFEVPIIKGLYLTTIFNSWLHEQLLRIKKLF